MPANTDVLGILEDARTRLEIAGQSAAEAESEAQSLLEYLQHESAEWAIAMAAESDHVTHSGQALAERWSNIHDRLRHLGEQLTSEYSALHQQLDTELAATIATWNECSERLPEIARHLQDHEQACQTSQQAHHDLAEAGVQAYSDVIAFAQEGVISSAENLGERIEQHRTDAEATVSTELASKQQRMRDAADAAREHQQSAADRVTSTQTTFNEQMTAEADQFERRLTADVDALKATASAASESLKGAAESIGALVGTLSEGADDVVQVMNATNVGLNTVVGIVHTGLEICDEVVDSFNG
jgi:hypothetical protein